MKKSEIYERAAKEMSERGMHKGEYVDPEGGRAVCLFGACFLGAGATVQRNVYYRLSGMGYIDETDAAELIEAIGGEQASDVPEYNDAEDTTQEDAVLALKRASEIAREKEEEEDAVTMGEGESVEEGMEALS